MQCLCNTRFSLLKNPVLSQPAAGFFQPPGGKNLVGTGPLFPASTVFFFTLDAGKIGPVPTWDFSGICKQTIFSGAHSGFSAVDARNNLSPCSGIHSQEITSVLAPQL